METAHYYSVNVNWEKDRIGLMSSPGLQSFIEVATPPEFAGGVQGIWSPEHLLVAAVDSCLMTTFLAIADNSKLQFSNFESYAIGKLEKIDGKYLISEIVLSPVLTIQKHDETEKAIRVLQKAEAACLISNSVKASIVFKPEIRVLENVKPIVQ